MTSFKNTAKGRRGVLLTGGSYVWLNPGETKSIDGSKIKRGLPSGVVEVNAQDLAQQSDEAESVDLSLQPDPVVDDEAELADVPYPANLVLVTIGENDVHTVSAPWLDEAEDYADAETAEARQLELRENGPPEDWVDPNIEHEHPGTGMVENEAIEGKADGETHSANLQGLDRDGDGAPGGSLPAEPVSLSGKTKAELTAIAEAESVDLAAVKGTGKDGRIIADDIKTAIEAHRAAQ